MIKISKAEKIRKHLREQKTISSWQAIQLYRVTRLSAIIFNLKAEGWDIETEMLTGEDGTPYGKYHLIEKQRQISLNLV